MERSEEIFLEGLTGVLRQSKVRVEICDGKLPPRRARPLACCGEWTNTPTSTPRQISQSESRDSNRFLNTHVPSIIHNSPKVETQMSING